MVQLTFTPHASSLVQQVEQKLDEAGLLFGRERDLVLAVATLAKESQGSLIWVGSHRVLGDELGCSARHVRRLCVSLSHHNLTWIECSNKGNLGHAWKLYVRPMSYLCPSSNRARTQVGHRADIARTQVGHEQAGTSSATRAGNPYTKNSLTENLRERTAGSADQAPAREEHLSQSTHSDSHHQFALRLRGWLEKEYAQTGIQTQDLERLVAPLLDGAWSERDLAKHIADTLPEYKMRCRTLKNALSALLGDMKRDGVTPSAPKQTKARELHNTVAPMSTPESFQKMLDYGTRNAQKAPKTKEELAQEAQVKAEKEKAEAAVKRRENLIKAAWAMAQQNRLVDIYEVRRTNTWEGIETRLRELGLHPEQQGDV